MTDTCISEYKVTCKARTKMELCNDYNAFTIAERIRDCKAEGLPTGNLEYQLEVEMTRMFTDTRKMLGLSNYNSIMNKAKADKLTIQNL